VRKDELTITERKWPLLAAADFGGIVHISDHNATLEENHPRHRNPTRQTYTLTRCGRPLSYTYHQTHRNLNRLRLCPRCGTREQFDAAKAEYDQKWAEHLAEKEALEAVRASARQLERDRQQAVLEALHEALAWDYEEGRTWAPVCAETDRGRVIHLDLSTQLPPSVTVDDGKNYAYPYLYRAVVTIELVPDDSDL